MKLIPLVVMVSAAVWVSTSPAIAQPPPQPGPPPPCVDAADVKFVCGQQGPEDLVIVPGGAWVVTGVFGGAGGINLLRVSDRTTTKAYPSASAKDRLDAKTYDKCPGPPDASKFTTHGLSILPGRRNVHRLFVVGHGGREAIEVFELDARPQIPVLTWIGCAVAADPIGLNSVRGLPDGGFIASNFLPRGGAPAATQRMMTGEKNGELWEWHTASGWQKVPGSEAAGANGLEMSNDGKTLYVAAWGSQSFFRVSRGKTPPTRDEIPLGFRAEAACRKRFRRRDGCRRSRQLVLDRLVRRRSHCDSAGAIDTRHYVCCLNPSLRTSAKCSACRPVACEICSRQLKPSDTMIVSASA